ncbi:hypothetical protein AMTR_s00088p00022360 [Amborella trichopoda]|uniref:CCHC-type domain-containing protein n=1 Tax=Amborella trichopoda TaxID=13333 RepID=W1NRA2_AMBTC|nr:hypothetical protein AMTR_s00088p00022360 [Amborella trichopoda]
MRKEDHGKLVFFLHFLAFSYSLCYCLGCSETTWLCFVEFDDRRDAVDAIRGLDGKNGWRVELSHNSKGGGGRGGSRGRGGGDDMKCYECGEPGHFALECRLRIGPGGLGSGRRRSPSPCYRRSPSCGRR